MQQRRPPAPPRDTWMRVPDVSMSLSVKPRIGGSDALTQTTASIDDVMARKGPP
jgi:hypothetical protein